MHIVGLIFVDIASKGLKYKIGVMFCFCSINVRSTILSVFA